MHVVRRGVGEVRILMLFVRNWRKQHDARRAFDGIILSRGVSQEFTEISFELLQSGIAMKRFIEAKEREDHIGLRLLQPIIWRAETLRARTKFYFVASHGQVAHDEIQVGMAQVKERFEP